MKNAMPAQRLVIKVGSSLVTRSRVGALQVEKAFSAMLDAMQ